ncbi:MAG: hypothetical protein WCE64_01690 [Bacteroidales bacterium]
MKLRIKIFLSVVLAAFILFSGISLNYSAHYCEGKVVSTRISLGNQPASCGMEQSGSRSGGDQLSDNCCETVAASFAISINYTSSTFDLRIPSATTLNSLFSAALIPSYSNLKSEEEFNTASPPGFLHPERNSTESLCIFRI